MQWKEFTAEGNTWERKENLKNIGKALKEFKGRMSAEVRRQEKINMAEERDFRRGELLGKFTVKMLYGWDDGKFEEKYLKKLEKNWRRWKEVSPEEITNSRLSFSLFYFSLLFSFCFIFLFFIFGTTRVRVKTK